MRLIDADALVDASCSGGVCAECDDMYGGNNVVTNCSEVRFHFLKLIKDAPTIEERKMGRWIWNPNGMDWGIGAWCCSECGIKAETWWATNQKFNPLGCSGGNFCGNCGADMRGGQDG